MRPTRAQVQRKFDRYTKKYFDSAYRNALESALSLFDDLTRIQYWADAQRITKNLDRVLARIREMERANTDVIRQMYGKRFPGPDEVELIALNPRKPMRRARVTVSYTKILPIRDARAVRQHRRYDWEWGERVTRELRAMR